MNGRITLVTGSDKISINREFMGVVGQIEALRKLEFFVDTHDEETPIPTMLFNGSHGLGKTYVAKKLAKVMNRRFIEVNCGTLKTEEDFIEGILLGQVLGESPATILLDEAHQLSSKVTTILLTLLNTDINTKNTIRYKNFDIVFDLAKINVIFASTDSYKVFAPLLSRCEEIYFDSYGAEELIDMFQMYCPAKIECDKLSLAEACRGRGRDTFRLAQKVSRYLKREKKDTLIKFDWDKIRSLFEISLKGLNRQEVELIDIISKNGVISSTNIALAMMVNVDNIESEIEIRPRELGLIKSTSRGRSLTEEGKQYILDLKKEAMGY